MECRTRNQVWKVIRWILPIFVLTCSNTAVCAEEDICAEPLTTSCSGCGQLICAEDCPCWNPSLSEGEGCTECEVCCREEDPCCERVEYVPYRPWEQGADAGLYCLPGSRCTYSCPTKPSGSQIYGKLGRLSHKLRYPREYSPHEWKTIMLHMRTIVPMTACNYRKALSFLQGKEYKPKKRATFTKRPASPRIEESPKTDEQENQDSEGIASENALAADDLSLEEMIGPISTEGVGFLETTAPAASQDLFSKFNVVFTGNFDFSFSSPQVSAFGDFNGNKSFFYSVAPLFLVSYGDNLLGVTKVAFAEFGQDPFLLPLEVYVTYFYNDLITFQFGKYAIPLGTYFVQTVHPWIEKSATFPLIRDFLGSFALPPAFDIGASIKGAIPLCRLGYNFRRASLTYELFIGNGPSEELSTSQLYPQGTIHTQSANSINNNNEFTYVGRIGFLPNNCYIFGLSYMRGRWSSNKRSFGLDEDLHYEAAAFDWNMNFGRYIVCKGEYIWSQYENSIEEFEWARLNGYWAQVAFDLGILECVCPRVYCCRPCLWDSLELSLRSEGVWNNQSGRTVLGFDYSGYTRKRFSLGLNYYFTQSCILKFGYDFNYGDDGRNTTLAFLTGADRKTGFSKDVFTLRFVYGW